jgi:hypothetical protein
MKKIVVFSFKFLRDCNFLSTPTVNVIIFAMEALHN